MLLPDESFLILSDMLIGWVGVGDGVVFWGWDLSSPFLKQHFSNCIQATNREIAPVMRAAETPAKSLTLPSLSVGLSVGS